MNCARCHKPIEEPRKAWKEMKGWVSPTGAKGFTQAQPTGRLMHESCLVLERSGIPDGQGLLA